MSRCAAKVSVKHCSSMSSPMRRHRAIHGCGYGQRLGGYYERYGWLPQGEALEYPAKPVKLYYRDL
ncbi:Uncharacterised protein [Pantoea agglomerans]|uniref:Uncharacterized protein n=1 Tax=Enterobacter agglomerans TaxID=549 RepID=A0A379ABK2_ENTAG|nr:Uncharacterised protein [Pantoea agglomerans]